MFRFNYILSEMICRMGHCWLLQPTFCRMHRRLGCAQFSECRQILDIESRLFNMAIKCERVSGGIQSVKNFTQLCRATGHTKSCEDLLIFQECAMGHPITSVRHILWHVNVLYRYVHTVFYDIGRRIFSIKNSENIELKRCGLIFYNIL